MDVHQNTIRFRDAVAAGDYDQADKYLCLGLNGGLLSDMSWMPYLYYYQDDSIEYMEQKGYGISRIDSYDIWQSLFDYILCPSELLPIAHNYEMWQHAITSDELARLDAIMKKLNILEITPNTIPGDIVSLMIDMGVDPEVIGVIINNGYDPQEDYDALHVNGWNTSVPLLHYASWSISRGSEYLEKIIKSCPDIDCNMRAERDCGSAPLHYAARGNYSSLSYLVKKCKVDLNIRQDKYGFSALHYAVRYSLDATRLLLAYGADINARGINNETPLYLASKYMHWSLFACSEENHYPDEKDAGAIVRYLIENGADPLAEVEIRMNDEAQCMENNVQSMTIVDILKETNDILSAVKNVYIKNGLW